MGAAAAPDWESTLSEPGPLRLETVVTADWAVPRSGLINLDNPRAVQAGLEDGDEPISIMMHAVRHPERGLYLVDSGVERRIKKDPSSSALGPLVRLAVKPETIMVHVSTADWLAEHGADLRGVFITHLHLDHVLGIPDVPPGTPLYIGPGERDARSLINGLVQPTTNRLLAGQLPLRAFEMVPDKRFEGVLDLFGDGSAFALHVPGHTPGSVAYLLRTTEGPVLLLGDACHTRWGWENGVEPGTFSADIAKSADSLARLKQLVADHPQIRVIPGHQQ